MDELRQALYNVGLCVSASTFGDDAYFVQWPLTTTPLAEGSVQPCIFICLSAVGK